MKTLVNENYALLSEFDKKDQARKTIPTSKKISKEKCLKAIVVLEEKKLASQAKIQELYEGGLTDKDEQQKVQTREKMRAFDELFNSFGIEEEQLIAAQEKFRLNSNNKEFNEAIQRVHQKFQYAKQ